VTNIEALIWVGRELAKLEQQPAQNVKSQWDAIPEPEPAPRPVTLADVSREELQAELYRRRIGRVVETLREPIPMTEAEAAAPVSVPTDEGGHPIQLESHLS
jgi:hypothetical protein